MEGLVRTALSDKPLLKEKISKGGGYALLGADGLIWLLDDSYQTEHHGPQAAQNSWAKATQIEEGESFLIMGGRVVTAYSTGLQTAVLVPLAVWLDRTGLVGHESPVSLGVFSRASFAIQPGPEAPI